MSLTHLSSAGQRLLSSQKLRAHSEHEQMLGEVRKTLRDMPGVWEQLAPEEKKEVLGLLIEDMQVSGRPGEGRTARIRLRYGPTYEAVLYRQQDLASGQGRLA
jgi:hypothetical protein